MAYTPHCFMILFTFRDGSKGLGEFKVSQQYRLDIVYNSRMKILFHILISPEQALKDTSTCAVFAICYLKLYSYMLT